MTEWRKIEGFPNYSVSDEGQVRNDKTGRILKPTRDHYGYLRLNLRKEGVAFAKYPHRLVAEAFIPNPTDKPTVDHINRDKTDNRVENLRWATWEEQRENTVGVTAPQRIIATKDGTSYEFESQHDCARSLGIYVCNINNCLQGRQKTCKGYTFRRVEE